MRRQRSGAHGLRAYIVLADIVFALSAGFMLLHPLSKPKPPPPPPPPKPAICSLCGPLAENLRTLIQEARGRAGNIDYLVGQSNDQ